MNGMTFLSLGLFNGSSSKIVKRYHYKSLHLKIRAFSNWFYYFFNSYSVSSIKFVINRFGTLKQYYDGKNRVMGNIYLVKSI